MHYKYVDSANVGLAAPPDAYEKAAPGLLSFRLLLMLLSRNAMHIRRVETLAERVQSGLSKEQQSDR
jgi:hypothetical protein